MKLDIITPESGIFSGEVTAVSLPGKDGIFQVLNNHAPIISALSEGILSIDLESPLSEEQKNEAIEIESPEKISVKIKGGVAELTNNKLIVLAE
ncbi:F0F1 ATP synthase subunit epsilon [Crocinitomicaceae bacterium]|jgi:F-type H+-transporting ATPase subunit epsilon|nr:F0F1 ATP synthase subunit epsilon [Flavobacteriales bacterium]MDC1244526.1 F0F1 ATP synthase subunit epsilon [Crocinitomicaceae bacterium]MDC1266733.1 F0F1 ATP synthase subunit epsilon [Crocinitomicaceae bacterium]MDC1361740.1 F0F1 ATP synthase subunit epsilon [Crocinitomicaceae bacterium]MDO7609226.1 F0F1 ATP synthase subunit epsilon [Crocinitomicaceae bacterium]